MNASAVDGDSEERQRQAVTAYARSAGLELIAEFYDAAVNGADPVADRPGFRALLARLGASGATKVVVESAHRFARDLWVQETGHRLLQKLGVELIAADSPGAFVDDGPTAVMVRQILGTVAQLEKAALVLKLRAARERTGHLGGWPKVSDSHPETARRARELTGSLRSIARVLALEGFASSTGRPFTPKTVAAMRSSAS